MDVQVETHYIPDLIGVPWSIKNQVQAAHILWSEKSEKEEPLFKNNLDYKIKWDYLLQLKNQFGIDCSKIDDKLDDKTKEELEKSPVLGYRKESGPIVYETDIDTNKVLGIASVGLVS